MSRANPNAPLYAVLDVLEQDIRNMRVALQHNDTDGFVLALRDAENTINKINDTTDKVMYG